MSLRSLSIFAFAVILGLSDQVAAVGFQPPSPDELKMTSEPQAPGAAAILLFRQIDRDDNGRTSHEDNYFRIKILKEDGRKYADVEIPYFKSEGNIVNIHARTIRPDGSIANFDGKVFDKSIAKHRGYKYLAKTFTLPDVQVGSIIEYSYTVDLSEHYVYDSHWMLTISSQQDDKFSLRPYSSSYRNFSLRWSWNALPPKTDPPKQGPDNIVRMEADNIPAFQSEDFMPPENELKSRVDFIYSEDSFEQDPTKYWKKVGKKLNDRLEGFVNKRKPMEQAVSQIVAPGNSQEVKLQKIYARVQQMRNTSYELQKTEQEKKETRKSHQKMSKKFGSGHTPTAGNLPGCIWPWREPRDLRLRGVGVRPQKLLLQSQADGQQQAGTRTWYW